MDLKSECSFNESVEDNDSITNVSASAAGNLNEHLNNGSCLVEDSCDKELFFEVKENGTKIVDSGVSPPPGINHEVSPSPSTTRKGFGLKKWKRIKRDVNKIGGSGSGAGNMPAQGLLSPGGNLSKRLQISSERKQKSEGSISSTNAVERGLGRFGLLGDSELVMEPLLAAGTDSENSEDHSSKSSTAASAPKIMYETRGVEGFPRHKSTPWSLSGNNMIDSMQHDLQIKSRVESSKKARGERVNIEKENSHSSVESDSQSSNLVFMQGRYSTSNGIQGERTCEYDGKNGDEVEESERKFNDGPQGGSSRDCEGGYKSNSDDDVAAESSWKHKEEASKSCDSSTDQDPLAESIVALQSVQEDLEKEVQKFREIIKDVSIDDSVQDLPPEFENVLRKLHETSSAQLQPDDCLRSFLFSVQSDVIESTDLNMGTEFENLFKQKIEAEIEYLVISRVVQKLRYVAMDQISILEDQKASTLEKTYNKAKMLKKESKNLENYGEDIATANETLKLKKRICKYTSYVFVQLVLLLVIFGLIVCQLSTKYMGMVPT